MRKLCNAVAAFALALFFASCSDILTEKVRSSAGSAGEKAYLSLSVRNAARIISPDGVTASDIKKAELLYRAIPDGKDAETLGYWESTETENAIALMSADETIALSTGTYEFTLNLYVASGDDAGTGDYVLCQTGSLASHEIVAGKNELAFTTAWTDGTGSLAVTLTWAADARITRAEAALLYMTENGGVGSAVKDCEMEPLAITTLSDAPAVTYAKTGIPNGSYYVQFCVYQNEADTEPCNTWCDIVKILSACLSRDTKTLEAVNTRYSITFQTNGGSWVDGYTPPESHNANTRVTLPTADSLTREHYTFAGWYTDEACTDENAISAIGTGSSTAHDYTLYAKWVPVTEVIQDLIEVSFAVNESDIEVKATDTGTTLVFTADEGYTTYTWKVDGVKADEADIASVNAAGNVLTVDASGWATGVYEISLKATDADGEYYSYLAQVQWTKKIAVSFNTDAAPESLAVTTPASQLILEGSTVTVPADVTPTYGWFTDSAFLEPFDFDTTLSSDLTLYGLWNLTTMYVSADGSDESDLTNIQGYGVAARPLATLSGAVALMNDENTDYTIYVDGELSGSQTIPASSAAGGRARSITLAGKNGIDEATEKPADSLNGADEGCTLTVSTTVPVTISNLTITGGSAGTFGGGLSVESGAQVTLSSGAVISGNSASRGSGVYVSSDGVLAMSGSATITSDNDVYLASGTKVTVTGELTGTSPVATITPETYRAETVVLEMADDAGTTLAAEYGKFAVSQPADRIADWKIQKDGTISTGFVAVTGGTFDDTTTLTPASSVFISERSITIADMIVSDHEVTQGEYEKYCKYASWSPSSEYGVGEDYPAYYVSWYDAIVYCNLRSIDEGLTPAYSIDSKTNPAEWTDIAGNSTDKYCGPGSNKAAWNSLTYDTTANGYRLPTEAEWEYLARGGNSDSYTYSGSDTIDDIAWYSGNSGSKAHEVKGKAANSLGLYDMSGNLLEWCYDWFATITSDTSATGAASGSNRVVRGGSWSSDESYCSVSHQNAYGPSYSSKWYGFRIVRNAN